TPSASRDAGRGRSAQGGPQAALVDPPEVVLVTVDEGHRELLRVPLEQVRVGRDVDLVPSHAELRADPCHDGTSVVAQVAARPAQERDPGPRRARRPAHAPSARSRPLATLPVAECGSWSTISTIVGHLNRARRAAAYAVTSLGATCAPGSSTT